MIYFDAFTRHSPQATYPPSQNAHAAMPRTFAALSPQHIA